MVDNVGKATSINKFFSHRKWYWALAGHVNNGILVVKKLIYKVGKQKIASLTF